ncbi:GntR family transcriptional regulator [Clostridium fermenticellae]|uniref:GntR family transcriptional regulator n=1 Tax=Clostridium fermenticellae TaxID=2068654 RepID=A0A386H6Z3_9CLOT|nr:GntR family transcriptional regulator [Clostridium fermenticellae]AYD41310.1 GntR family transcriptional regulator [Clostridium fermenticellae]
MNIIFNDKIPIYIQITNLIKRDIVSGKLKPGNKLPSIREMSSKFKVNPNTIQRSYQELERENITYTQRGTGSFVNEEDLIVDKLKEEMARESIDTFLKQMKDLGFIAEDILNIVKEELEEEE